MRSALGVVVGIIVLFVCWQIGGFIGTKIAGALAGESPSTDSRVYASLIGGCVAFGITALAFAVIRRFVRRRF